jgi:hypothetical protein
VPIFTFLYQEEQLLLKIFFALVTSFGPAELFRKDSWILASTKMALYLSVSFRHLVLIQFYTPDVDRGSVVVKVPRYDSEGRWFDPRWCHRNFSLT